MISNLRSTLPRVIALSLALAPAALSGQTPQSHEGAFARAYPEAARLVNVLKTSHAALLEQLFTERNLDADRLEGAAFDHLVQNIESGKADAETIREAMPRLSREMPRLAGIIERAHALHREIYDIYADDRVVNKVAAVDAAIDRYLSDPNLALPARPKSMDFMTTGPYASTFRTQFPKTNGLMWASHWLQLALYDPLMYYASAADQREGIEVVVERFEDKLTEPDALPTEMPTPAAISPELVRRYPRAAAIFDNLHMLHDVVADLLVHPEAADKRVAIETAIGQMYDPNYMAVSDYDWMVMSLRHGIYNQGGPAIGTLARSERNVSGHHMDHTSIMPGMGSGPNGEVVIPDPDSIPKAPDHSGH